MRQNFVFIAASVSLLVGCPGETPADAGTTFDAGEITDAGVGIDAGPDAGAIVDAGFDAGVFVDAGFDAGVLVDAGFDAGVVVDAGFDAGVLVDAGFDAGVVVDAGFDAGVVDDAGFDAGVAVDAGFDAGVIVDAGFDAGVVDAGFDAGVIVDAGFDAGVVDDAGFEVPEVSDGGLLVRVDTNDEIGVVSPSLFGINFGFKSGPRTMDRGDIIRDRSFLRLNAVNDPSWFPFVTDGTVDAMADPGAPLPAGGNAKDGFVRLSLPAAGFTCVSEILLDRVTSGRTYDLHVSHRGVGGAPTWMAFLADGFGSPIEPTDNLATSTDGIWNNTQLSLAPTIDAEPAVLFLCQTSAGTLDFDEIRLMETGGEPVFDPLLVTRITELGITGLRWPGGTVADTFDWRAATGPLLGRPEVADEFDRLNTPSFGLHEFLNLCEAQSLHPLIVLNVLAPPEDAGDLVEYILGDTSTPMGALRDANGRAAPWNVSDFEVGNEPALKYAQVPGLEDTAGTNYAILAAAVAVSARTRGDAIGVTLRLSSVVETAFSSAPFLPAVPILRDWNPLSYAPEHGLLGVTDVSHGHFYAFDGTSPDERVTFENVMASAETLRTNFSTARDFVGARPMWVTEFHTIIRDGNIVATRLWDAQSGLAMATMLLTLVEEEYDAAYLFNLAEFSSFGILTDDLSFSRRPAAHAFELLSPLANSQRLQTTLTGATSRQALADGETGINALATEYEGVRVLASRDEVTGGFSVYILNAQFDVAQQVGVYFDAFQPTSAVAYVLAAPDLTANNEIDRTTVVVESQALSIPVVLDVAAKSVVRIDFLP